MRRIPVSVGDAEGIEVGEILVDEDGRRFKVTGIAADGRVRVSALALMEWNWRTRLKEWILDRVRTLRLR